MTSFLKRVVIKEELVELTGNYIDAILLNQMIYWSERIYDFDLFIAEEKERAARNEVEINIESKNGWIYKKADELAEETMVGLKKKAVLSHLSYLVEQGWLERRRNPDNKMDKTYQYRVNIVKIQFDLMKNGYVLDGYKLSEEIQVNLEKLRRVVEETSVSLEETTEFPEETSNDVKETPNGDEVVSRFPEETSKLPHETAIPEITYKDHSEIIAEIKTDIKDPHTSSTRKIDEMLHERLKNTFSRATYESWFADTHIYDMDSDNTYIASPVEFILKFLEERHKETLQEILKDIMGNPGEIKFVLLK